MSSTDNGGLTRLHLDDGSRIMMEQNNLNDDVQVENKKLHRDSLIPIETYYEIERISKEILDYCQQYEKSRIYVSEEDNEELLYRVALQFPDELLSDSMQVSWLLEEECRRLCEQINSTNHTPMIMCFVLGDTTYGSCCPDEVGAAHLQAHLLVHYGTQACLSPTESLPVIYSFGTSSIILHHESSSWLSKCCQQVAEKMKEQQNTNKHLLILYQVQFHSIIPKLHGHLQSQLTNNDQNSIDIVVGSIPDHYQTNMKKSKRNKIVSSQTMSNSVENSCTNQSCCINSCANDMIGEKTEKKSDATPSTENPTVITIGGLELPSDINLSNYILLYVGDDTEQSTTRQFVNIILRCSSSSNEKDHISQIWSWNPTTHDDESSLNIDPMADLKIQKYLNRRFFVIQKARMASIYGILVGTLSQSRFRNVISKVKNKISSHGKASYTLVVGKLNIAKLTNFAEIECFVLIACPETSVWQEEREFPIPIITPAELDIALDEQQWGEHPWSANFTDYLNQDDMDEEVNPNDQNNDSEDDDDKPFFSVVTGTYVSKSKRPESVSKTGRDQNLEQLPGGGQMTEYRSEAAEYWKRREYKGLEANIGRNEVRAAVKGQVGIASNYKEN